MKIDIVDYNDARYPSHKSDRSYIVHQITSTIQENEGGYYGPSTETVITRFYEDTETGIITRDVAKYEAWMNRVDPR